MRFTNRCLGAEDLVREIAQLLPNDVPSAEGFGPALRSIFREMARTRAIDMREPGSDRQLKALWYDGDALLLAAESGWGDQSDLERSFANLLLLKSPQKVLVYTSLAGQD